MELLKKIKYYFLGNFIRSITAPFYQYEIDPKDACTIFGSRFGNGWNHIIETLKEYDNNPNIDYKDTSLYDFLKYFKPESISDLTNNHYENKIEMFYFPWGSPYKKSNLKRKIILQSRFCGPSTDEFIKKEFDDIIYLYKKLKHEGYKPHIYPNSFIIGTWLVSEDKESVFIVFGGNHRMAILSHIGLKKIKVRTHKMLIRKVYQSQLQSWPLVINNECSIEHAKNIFNFFFQKRGFHLKEILNNKKLIK